MYKSKPILLALILFISALACQVFTPMAVGPAGSGVSGTQMAVTPRAHFVSTASVAAETAVTHADPLEVLQTWFYQEKDSPTNVHFAFLVQNPNTAVTVVRTDYRVVAYDAANTALGSGEAQVSAIFPAEIQIASSPFSITVPDNTVVDRVEVEVATPGTPDATLNVKNVPSGGGKGTTYVGSPFETSNVKYFPNQYGAQVSGTVRNIVGNIGYFKVNVSAVAFDANRKIVGVTLDPALINVQAGGTTNVVTDIQLTGDPAEVELFPALSQSWGAWDAPTKAEPVQVIRSGASQDPDVAAASYGLVVKNTDQRHERVNIGITVTGFDADGAVIGVDSRIMDIIFPGEQTGTSWDMSLIENTKLARIEVQVESEDNTYDLMDYQKAGLAANPLEAKGCNLISGPAVSCMLTNSFKFGFEVAAARVVAYDAAGAVIGGGDTVVDNVPAQGQIAFEIDRLPEQTKTFEVYAEPGSLARTALTQVPAADTLTPTVNFPTPETNGGPAPACDTSTYIIASNATGAAMTLELHGPFDYRFTLLPGTNKLLVCLGAYTFTASGCQGGLLTGTISRGDTHEFYCSK